jgi:uncharacterized protein GlcG (DUF336 family)
MKMNSRRVYISDGCSRVRVTKKDNLMYSRIVSVGLALAIVIGASSLVPRHAVEAQAAFKGEELTLEAAQRIIEAALKKSRETNVRMNVTVLDAGGNLKAFVRMDGAYLGSMDISMKKAKTSVMFPFPSGTLGGMSQPGGDLYGIERSNDGLITFAGGIPLMNASGKHIGAIGVSGGSVAEDETVAKAGAAAL